MQQLVTVTSPLRQRSAILEIIPWTQNAYTLLFSLDTGMRLIRRFTLWFERKQRSLVAQLTQKSVRIFHTFLDLDSVIYLAVNGTVTSLPVFI